MGMLELAESAVQNDWKVGLDVPVKPKVNVQVALAGSHSKLASFLPDHTRKDKYSFMSHEVSCGYYSDSWSARCPRSPAISLWRWRTSQSSRTENPSWSTSS
ncbi:unnamed protein product [Lepidochelys kempii]